MNKLSKLFLIGILLIGLSFTIVYATTENEEDSSDNDVSTTSVEDEISNEIIEETPTTGLSTLSTSSSTSISSLNSYSQANLELNNILCIILIAVGVVIVLLAIAILIRLKK